MFVGCCWQCGERGEQIHHIDKNYNNNSLDNLEYLCLECHILRHPEKEFEMRMWAEMKSVGFEDMDWRLENERDTT